MSFPRPAELLVRRSILQPTNRLFVRGSLTIAFVFAALITVSLHGSPTSARKQPPKTQAQGANSVANVLNEDGSLKPGLNGSFDTNGFRMELSPSGAPLFVPAQSCTGWDTQFGLPNGTNGQVNALAASGNSIYVGGNFSAVSGNVLANNVAKFDTTTNTWSALAAPGGNGVNSSVSVLAINGSDLYVGGGFSSAGGGVSPVAVNRVAKFDTNTNTWSKLGTDGNGVSSFTVNALAFSGSILFVGGNFTTANAGGTTVAANDVAKYDTTTGVWSNLGTGGGNGVTGGFGVKAIAVNGTELYVGGDITTANVGGTTVAVNRIAKYNSTTGAWTALGNGGGNGVGPANNSSVNALALSGSALYVGGNFTIANVGGTTVSVNNVAKYDTTTGAWSALGTVGASGVNLQVFALVVSGTDVYVGGQFTTANGGGPTVAANYVAKYDTTASAWSALGTDGKGVTGGAGPVVSALAVNGTGLYAGGFFGQANAGGTTVPANHVARFDTSTSQWSKLGNSGGNGANFTVTAVAVSGTDVYVGGNFAAVSEILANCVAKFDTTTNTWSALGAGGGNGVTGGQVSALAISGSTLYVGGFFRTANAGGTTVAVNNVAKYDITTGAWSKLGTGSGNGVNNFVNALALNGSDLYLGGFFSTANVSGTTVAANFVAKFDTGANTWSALGTGGGNGVNSSVSVLAVSGTDVYVGGAFTTANVGGTTVTANRVAKFNTTTSTWSKLGTDGSGVNNTVSAMAIIGSNVYVGGSFTQANVGGATVTANRVAKFDPTTNIWSSLGSGSGNGVSGSVSALAASGSTLYVGGQFGTANTGGTTVSATNVARLDTSSGIWSQLRDTNGGNGVSAGVNALAVSDAGLFVGGTFAQAGDGVSSYIGKFCDMPPPSVTINQASAQADPTNTSPINFTVVFSDPVSDFATGDVTLSGTAGATTAIVTGSGTTYNVAVSGMTANGTVIATVAVNRATNVTGNPNTPSTSTDNTVTFTAFPASITANAGTPQSATINTAFATALQAIVKDGSNSPVSGVSVTFTAPATGASGTFANGTTTTTATTDASGVATATAFTANGTAGGYNVTATAGSLLTSFAVTNNKATPAITFGAAPTPTFGGGNFTVSASTTNTDSSTLTYSVMSGPCALVSGATFSSSGAGTCVVKADGAATTNFNAAANTQNVTIAKANQTITFPPLADKTFGDPDFTVSATASSGLTVSFTASGQCTVTGSTVHLTAVGSCTITAKQAGDLNYNAASDLPRTFNINPAGGFISFSTSNYSVNEATGFVMVMVNRTGATTAAVNVDYATSDTGAPANCGTLNSGLASSRCDFTALFGTLNFAANETQKTLNIPINQDSFAEGPEVFTINLSNPTGGAALAVPSSPTITINDSAAPAPNTNDDTTAFVRQQYHDFLNREPDPDGLAFWIDNIDGCNNPARRPTGQTAAQCIEIQRINTSAAFFLSIEFLQSGGLVRDFYVAALDRPLTNNMPGFVEFMRDTQRVQRGIIVGQTGWQAALDANRTSFINDFVTRAEFVGLYPTTDSPTQYVDKLIAHAGVTLTSSERTAAINEFASTNTASDAGARGRALLQVTQNAAFQAREFNRAFVHMQYLGYLRRDPNAAPDTNFNGYDFWLNKLIKFKGNYLEAEMVRAFISSFEYRGRFGP